MKKFFQLLFTAFIINSCGVNIYNSGNEIKEGSVIAVDFCELSKYNGKLIKTELEYSGFEDYWSAQGFLDCSLNNEVNLNFEKFYDNDNEKLIEKKLNRLYNNHATKKAKMEVVGVFKFDSINRFGHLNTYPAEIMVLRTSIQIEEKKKTAHNNGYK